MEATDHVSEALIANQQEYVGAGPVPSGQSHFLSVCPPGMEILLSTSMILVKQQVELLEVFTGFDTRNRYEVLDMAGRRMFLAAETTSCCVRVCFFGSRRPFTILILNNHGGIALKVKRLCTCALYCCGGACCNEIRIYTGTDVYIGKVVDKCCNCCCPRFGVWDADDKEILSITGPCNLCMCCSVSFTVKNMEGEEVGEIKKKWGGVGREVFTTADTFGVTFPLAMDPRHKTLMLGAVFLIDFMYFEHGGGSGS